MPVEPELMNDTVLITFLGRLSKREGAYRTTRYRFEQGLSDPVAFFGWALKDHLQPGRMTILGTPGSMWDHLFEVDIELGNQHEDERLVLQEAVERQAVTTAMLDGLEPVLGGSHACEVALRLIPYGHDQGEQVELLRTMAATVTPGAEVHIDITHGFRHLPMLVLLAALYLEKVKGARVKGIWYGAFDPDTREAPVYNLQGLLRIAAWLEALGTYGKDGDYGIFAPLLADAGDLLARASFHERTTNPVMARQALTAWASRPDTERFPQGDPAAELFRDEIEHRIDWYRRSSRQEWECALAWQYLERRDFLRAAIFAVEGTISTAVDGGDVNDYAAREQSREKLLQASAQYKKLNNLRNALAHGVRPWDRKLSKILQRETDLFATMKGLFTDLMGRRS